jgi:hypothetical protein
MSTRQIFIITLLLIVTSVLIVTLNTRTITPTPIIFAQTSDGNTRTGLSTAGIITFTYTKVGILSEIYQRIAYDSKTNVLSISNSTSSDSTSQASSSQLSKQLSESDTKNLESMIMQNRFFETSTSYPPPPSKGEYADYFLYILNIAMNGRTHTVFWTSISNTVPQSLLKITDEIENISLN